MQWGEASRSMDELFPLIWLLGACFAIDEMKIGFQGMHADKKRITYKSEVDGFQADALCEDGFCFQFYFRNDPEDVEYTKTVLFAFALSCYNIVWFGWRRSSHLWYGQPVQFCNVFKRVWNHKRKLMVHGVTRKGMWGIPGCVVQEDQKSRKKQLDVRGTTKSEILKGNPTCP